MFISIYTILIIGKYHIDIYNFYGYSGKQLFPFY